MPVQESPSCKCSTTRTVSRWSCSTFPQGWTRRSRCQHESPSRGGYEIVDKFARKEIFIQGALAESFKQGVQALIETDSSEEEMDEYIERFASLSQQPLVLH